MDRPIKGIYRIRTRLLIDPKTGVFPDRCIFTNEPVKEHSLVKLANVEAVGMAPLLTVMKDECYLSLPVSDKWRRRKIGRWLAFAFFLKLIGIVFVLGGILVPIFADLGMEKTTASVTMGVMFGSVLLLVGFFIPRLEDTVDVNCIYRVGFLKCGLVIIPGASKAFLEDLPVATTGWLHGFLWFESIKLPDVE